MNNGREWFFNLINSSVEIESEDALYQEMITAEAFLLSHLSSIIEEEVLETIGD